MQTDGTRSMVHSFDGILALVNALPSPAWLADSTGHIIGFNDKWRSLTDEQHSGEPCNQLLAAMPADDGATFRKEWAQGISGKVSFQLDLRLWSGAEAKHRWHSACVAPYPALPGQRIAWVAICHDTDRQHQAEEEAKVTTAQLNALIETLPVGVVIFDRNRTPVRWNTTFIGLRGLDIDPSNWVTPVHPDDRKGVIESWDLATKENKSWSRIYRLVHPDGNVVWVSGRGKPIEVDNDRIGFVRTAEDVTAIKTDEQNLTATNRELQELTRRLDAEVQARTEKLREALAELDKLSYSIVHDMRAPMRTIIGFSEILLEDHADQLDDEAKELLRRMSAAARRQDLLIDSVLAYHRYVRREFPLAPVDLDQLVNSILATYPLLQPPKAYIHVQRPLGWVIAHEMLLTQCVSALLNNACKFIPSDTIPEVVVRTEKEHNRVKLWIEDNGIGIAPEHHSRIFNIFEVLDKDRHPGSTGIGLPLAKKAVERMKGTIGVESVSGGGARFWINLPRITAS